MGAWIGSPCDTLTVGLTENNQKEDVFFQAWYNHEWNMIHVNASKLKGKAGQGCLMWRGEWFMRRKWM
ncbi:MAG: hypothetical protein IPO63_08670, partial [Bacteroidetes bacterium]|nr:hypothetical protein [Bacteroidota bacterium]